MLESSELVDLQVWKEKWQTWLLVFLSWLLWKQFDFSFDHFYQNSYSYGCLLFFRIEFRINLICGTTERNCNFLKTALHYICLPKSDIFCIKNFPLDLHDNLMLLMDLLRWLDTKTKRFPERSLQLRRHRPNPRQNNKLQLRRIHHKVPSNQRARKHGLPITIRIWSKKRNKRTKTKTLVVWKKCWHHPW